MIILSPEVIWGNKLEKVDKNLPDDTSFNICLKPEATDEEKTEFEDYMMNLMSGWFFLKYAAPGLKKPYYTWEGKIVELASLKYRELPPVKESPWPDDMR